MDGRGVYMLGATTYEAVETQISFNMRCAHEDDWQFLFALDRWPEVSRRLAALGIVPDPSKADRNYDGEHGRPVLPAVPEGWRHIPSADGVGVLAPASQFHPSFPHVLDDPSSPASALEAATSYAAEHFPAAALWLLREGYWRSWPPPGIGICRAMIDVYLRLGGASLAAVWSIASRAP